MDGEYVRYSFRDDQGEYYGGSEIGFGLLHFTELGTIVLYSAQNPQINKIAVSCLPSPRRHCPRTLRARRANRLGSFDASTRSAAAPLRHLRGRHFWFCCWCSRR